MHAMRTLDANSPVTSKRKPKNKLSRQRASKTKVFYRISNSAKSRMRIWHEHA